MIDLEELEKMAKEATPGPWRIDAENNPAHFIMTNEDIPIRRLIAISESPIATCDLSRRRTESCANAAYIVAACNAVPELIAENRALREKVQALESQRDWLIHYAWIDTNAPCPYEMGYFDQKKICPCWTPYNEWEKAEDMSRDDWHDLLMEGVVTEEDKVNCGTDFCDCLLMAAKHEAAKESGK